MSGTARALLATWRGAWLEALASRRGFWAQISVMVVNDLVWVVFWVLFFHRVGAIRGWDVDQVLVLLSVATTSFGVALGVLANSRWIGSLTTSGGLDAALSLPVPTLPYLLCRRVETVFVGDVVFGLALFFGFAQPTPARTLVFAASVVCSSLLATGALVLMGSLSLRLGLPEPADLGLHMLTLFSVYPIDLFSGATKMFLYLVIPAGFVATVPSRLIEDFDPWWAGAGVAMAVAFATAGWLAFNAAVRGYTGGSVWTDA